MKALILFLTFVSFISCKEPNNKNTDTVEKITIESHEKEIENPVQENYAQQTVNDELAERIKTYLKEVYLKNDIDILEENDRKFQLYEIDLNDDDENEVFINFFTRYFCGTGGCAMLLLDTHLKPITKFSVMNPPLFVEKTKKNKWAIILIKDAGVYKELIYSEGKYPSNPSVLEKAPYDAPSGHAEILFSDDYSKAKTYTY
ncbi:hypothetical protein JM658_09200 [Joostella atrarenae]|uniref:Lipoprotein n=1 Tax=Joostella atrarenae TaxID=679257 RepID=A0ABS9J3J4_9FLAO|nr:hypothetical protein [Joostella atrarenae]MCF8714998.1 hypothetical protein [Joostella atrarenae]